MRYRAYTVLAAAAAIVSACDNPKSAEQVAHDTVSAEQAAVNNAAKAQQKADARIASARADVREEQRDLAHVNAVEGQKVADTQATGDYKVELAQCESLSGATQRACKDQADADYQVARAKAKQEKVSADPKP